MVHIFPHLSFVFSRLKAKRTKLTSYEGNDEEDEKAAHLVEARCYLCLIARTDDQKGPQQ